jgi:hypothetical protein
VILSPSVSVFLLATALLASCQEVPPSQNSRPDAPLVNSASYVAITPRQRFQWFVDRTVGPPTLTAGLFVAGFGTAQDRPKEYGPHWAGFGKRYGIRLTGISTGNAMEASLGAIWGEDPRYKAFRQFGQPFKDRVRRVAVMTFVARDRSGNFMPAYARYIAMPANNFLSNAWRADSEANTRSAIFRTFWGFLGLMGRNAFDEFWPDVQRRVFHGKAPNFPGTAPASE